MRCPKCSYLSFDLVETCVKCGKNISEAATELQGTVAGVAAPVFLRVAGQEAPPEAPEESVVEEGAAEETLDLGAEEEGVLDLGDEEESGVDFSFDDEPSAEAETESVEMDFGEDVEQEETAELDLGEEAPDLDFGAEAEVADDEEAIGISDLAPGDAAEDVQAEEPAEEFEMAVEETAEEAAAGGQGLADLKVDGLDLDSTAGAVDTEKVMPSVKTGTALDEFDIDLGDLMSSKDE